MEAPFKELLFKQKEKLHRKAGSSSASVSLSKKTIAQWVLNRMKKVQNEIQKKSTKLPKFQKIYKKNKIPQKNIFKNPKYFKYFVSKFWTF